MVDTFNLVDNWRLKLYALGLEPEAIISHAGLNSSLFNQESATITDADYFRLFDAIHAHLPDIPVGLAYIRNVPIEAYSLAFLLALSSQHLQEALQQIGTYRKLLCPLRIKIEEKKVETTIEFDNLGATALPESTGIVHVCRFVHLLRTGTRSDIDPLWVSVTEMPEHASAYEDAFRIRLRRGETFGVGFSPEHTTQPFLTADPQKAGLLASALTARLTEIERTETTEYRVRLFIRERLSDSTLSVGDISKALGISIRSLQRQLAKEGTTFKQLLNEARNELACYYLSSTEKPIREVARLVGFEDSNSFFRVFKGWTGQTPGGFRESSR